MKKQKNKKICLMAFSEIITMIIATFAFAFIIGGMTAFSAPVVSAQTSPFQSKCCLETVDGAVCQNILETDAALCKSQPLFTSCENVQTCKTGCCYNPSEGICALNSPKEKCEGNGGTWNENSNCEIPQCQIGCCVIADQASTTTVRECSVLSEKYGVKPNFQALDSDGSCDSKTELEKKGACLTPAKDYSGLNDCKFTTKGQCKSGEFKEDYLCTAKELKTNCKPKKDTTCVDGKDGVYYVDTCGNPANIYDLNKFSNDAYWAKVVERDSSCGDSGNPNCGNCDYMTGSICREYRAGKDAKPSAGNYVCRNLNCINGRKNGESWCISDYSNTGDPAVAPVGARNFVGKCINGEISIEPCADFNNEICISGKSDGFSEAKCTTNQWRSCMAVNNKETYQEAKDECDKYDQCAMFLDIADNEKYSGLPGFKKDIANSEQGKAGEIGRDANKVINHCVPKYTPGMVFWNIDSSANKISISSTGEITGKQNSPGDKYGGSYDETKAICSQGSFTCVTRYERWVTAIDKGSWEVKENPECIKEENAVENQKFIDGLAERCKALGPCGVKVNIAGEFGDNAENNNFKRTEIGVDGKQGDKKVVEENKLSNKYLDSVKSEAKLTKPGSLNKITGASVSWITGNVLEDLIFPKFIPPYSNIPMLPQSGFFGKIGNVLGKIGGNILTIFGAMAAAYGIGQMVGVILGLSQEQTKILSLTMAGAGLSGGLAFVMSTKEVAAAWGIGVGLVVFLILSVFITGKESKYYITEYTCEPWEPPQNGNCDLCNKDIRACSEYRCRSLGQNCQYFIENGEPGYCSSTKNIWSAKITPWQNILSEGNKYANINEKSFEIQDSQGRKVAPWIPLTFGIQTDKPATCKIDTKHTQSYDEMQYDMQVEIPANSPEEAQTISQGYYHKITLSPHVMKNSSSSETPGIAADEENNYYIRCKNFAGQENDAEFAVRIRTDKGEDITPPVIKSFYPESGKYLKFGENSSSIAFSVNEPSECRYSSGTNFRYEEMPFNATCNTNSNSAVAGNWQCYARLNNLKAGENKFYFACKDQPNAAERVSSTRNTNRNNKEYSAKVCDKGLNIDSLEPKDTIITGKSSASVELKATTSGCIENGKSICYYKFEGENYSETYIPFLNTDSTIHSQMFTEMPAGENNISIKCEDSAGNAALSSVKINVFLDNSAPEITRVYLINSKLRVLTNENAVCKYTNNKSIGCEFDFEAENLETARNFEGAEKEHDAVWLAELTQDYYIKCEDAFGNINPGCSMIARA